MGTDRDLQRRRVRIWQMSSTNTSLTVSYTHLLQKRLDNEKVIKFKSYVNFYKSIVDQDRASVVICNLKHEIIYMNPAAVISYAKRGGDKLVGRSLLDCHNPESRDKIRQVVDWFAVITLPVIKRKPLINLP